MIMIVSFSNAFNFPLSCTFPSSYTYQLKQLNITKDVQGSFFLANGSFNNARYFEFYIKQGNYYKLIRASHHNVKIFETNSLPRATMIIDNAFNYNEETALRKSENVVSYITWEITIPENSISESITIDLNKRGGN